MSLSSILAILDPTHGAATLRLASLASEALGAPVDAIVANSDPRDAIPMVGEALSADIIAQVIDAAEAGNAERTSAVRALFDAAPPGKGATLEAMTGRLADLIAREGRTHGMTLVSCGGADPIDSETIDAALFETGRPVLIAPLQEVKSVSKRAAIFWQDTPEAAKAVWSAVPFLRNAETVKVFTVADDAVSSDALDRIGAGLRRARIDATVELLAPDRIGAASRLIDAASDMDSDLIVMGAYSHSRLQEYVFGGVTKMMLESLARPVFMAH